MRFTILLSGCLASVITSPLNGTQFSETRDLPPLKLAASEFDAILNKTHSFLNAVNGPTGQDFARESVTLGVRGHEIEIPHFSLASSVAFPNEIFAFSYKYSRNDKPVSSVTIDLGDSSRQILVRGESADKVRELSLLLEDNFHRYAMPIRGAKFRHLAGVCLSTLFLTSLMISALYCWKARLYSALGTPICSALGFLLLLVLPWNRLLPGFVLYQRCSHFFLIRHASQISVFILVGAVVGIPLSYFLCRNKQ
jgi:hypothetical protein